MKSSTKIIVALLTLLVGGGLLFMGSQYLDQGSIQDGVSDAKKSVTGDSDSDSNNVARWTDSLVKKQLQVKDKSNSFINSGTVHLYENKPEEWENQRTIENTFGDEFTTYSISGDTTTIQEYPGTYYVVVEHSGAYYTFDTITLPDGSEDRHQEKDIGVYNNNPETDRMKVADYHSLSSPAYDLGVTTNDTETREIETEETYSPADDTEYRLWKAVVETGAQDPTTDSDSDGVMDEGISQAYLEVSGGVDQDGSEKTVFFNPNNGIDMLGAEDKANVIMDDLVFDEDNKMTVTVGVMATETEDGSAQADGDEKLSDGDEVLKLTLFDDLANSNTQKAITG